MFYYNSTTNCKSNEKQKVQTWLSQNYDFVLTNLLKMSQKCHQAQQNKFMIKQEN